jgi:hypothetical protein
MGLLARARTRLTAMTAGAAERRFRREVRSRGGEVRGAQLFILGLPRSGTTLVYQYIVHRLHVAYFTNAVGRRPYDPCRATWEQVRSGDTYRSDFQSEYGRSRGDLAPREAGNFWLRFFDIDAYQTPGDVKEADLAEMRESVHCTQALFSGAPFVNKNVKHVLRIPVLAACFADAHFLVVERDRVDVALSLLRARIDTLGSYDAWFSVKPPDYARLRGLDAVEQVAGQVLALERKMDDDLAGVGAGRVHRLDYQAFCRSPDSVIAASAPALSGVKEKNPPVDAFEVRRAQARNDTEARLVERLRGADGV